MDQAAWWNAPSQFQTYYIWVVDNISDQTQPMPKARWRNILRCLATILAWALLKSWAPVAASLANTAPSSARWLRMAARSSRNAIGPCARATIELGIAGATLPPEEPSPTLCSSVVVVPAVAVIVVLATVIPPVVVVVSIVVPPVAKVVVSAVAVSPVAVVVVGLRCVRSSSSCPPLPCRPSPSLASSSSLCPPLPCCSSLSSRRCCPSQFRGAFQLNAQRTHRNEHTSVLTSKMNEQWWKEANSQDGIGETRSPKFRLGCTVWEKPDYQNLGWGAWYGRNKILCWGAAVSCVEKWRW